MPVKIFRNVKYSTTHENKIFDEFIENLDKQWSDSNDLIVVLGNFYCKGTQIDALIVKKDSISIIDFKDYGGKIIFSENNRWSANGVEIVMSEKKLNPYLQIHFSKFELLDKLKTSEIFNKGNEINLGHISGIALFHKPIEFDRLSIPPKISNWFHVIDNDHATRLLYQITSENINLIDEEIERFPLLFDLKQYEFVRPKITIEEQKLLDKQELCNEFIRLIDIHKSIKIAEKESALISERHKIYCDYFFIKTRPISHNLIQYYEKYESIKVEFIEKQKKLLQDQIQKIHNLNTNNGFVLDEFTNGKVLRDCLLSRVLSSKIFKGFKEKYHINYKPSALPVSTIEACKDIFYHKAIYDETLFKDIELGLTNKKLLINNLHAIYVICRFWFADDIIKHGLEREKSEVEHVYARGFSKKWKENVERNLNAGIQLKTIVEERLLLTDEQEKELKKYPERIQWYLGSRQHENIIIEVEIPEPIRKVFSIINKNIEGILNEEEYKIILSFFNINWIQKESISLIDLFVIDFKTHFIYNLENDFDFIANKEVQNFEYRPNQQLFEPIYLTLFEQIGINFLYSFKNSVEIENSYKKLSSELVSKIDNIIGAWEIYKSKNWYHITYNNSDYHFNNRLNIGYRDDGTEYQGITVSKELQITTDELKSFLNQIKDEKVYGSFHYTGIGDRYYIQALKRFKNYANIVNKPIEILSSREETIKNEYISKATQILSKPEEQVIIGYSDVKHYIEQRLVAYSNPAKAKEFGLGKTAGIMLYGPPGCGKTYWANWIAKYLELTMEEVPRSLFGSSFYDGAMTELESKLTEIEEKAPVAIFFDEFDSIGMGRDKSSGSHDESRKVVTTLLARIPKLVEKGIMILAATNFINDLDAAVVRPGRFDLHIPIFPPLPDERAEIIMHYLLENNPPAIHEILKNNFADESEYWLIYTEPMYLFSNSHVLEFCKELKSYIFNQSLVSPIEDIFFTDAIINEIINTIKSMIRRIDVEQYIRFYNETENLMDIFKKRRLRLKFEIDKFTGDNNGHSPVGFKY